MSERKTVNSLQDLNVSEEENKSPEKEKRPDEKSESGNDSEFETRHKEGDGTENVIETGDRNAENASTNVDILATYRIASDSISKKLHEPWVSDVPLTAYEQEHGLPSTRTSIFTARKPSIKGMSRGDPIGNPFDEQLQGVFTRYSDGEICKFGDRGSVVEKVWRFKSGRETDDKRYSTESRFNRPRYLYLDHLQSQTDENRVTVALLRAMGKWQRKEWREMMDRASKALDIASTLDYEPLNARCTFYQGIAWYEMQHYSKAQTAFESAVACCGKYREGDWVDDWKTKTLKALHDPPVDASSSDRLESPISLASRGTRLTIGSDEFVESDEEDAEPGQENESPGKNDEETEGLDV